ncbi:MAG: polyhydroxyalkanoic acid system family protein [Parvularculaceae bacterium]|nr:polyhydroxyalkanoic acid system family protein [Parvularculaceae bacterium]
MARPVTIILQHDLGAAEAGRRLKAGWEKLRGGLAGGMMFRFEDEWVSDTSLKFTARGLGQTITGAVDVFPQHVRIEATLPGLLATLAETIAGRVEKEGQILLEKK